MLSELCHLLSVLLVYVCLCVAFYDTNRCNFVIVKTFNANSTKSLMVV